MGVLSSVDLWPTTGRKHQLRRHLAEVLGCPIVGDVRYVANGQRTLRCAPLLLAAVSLAFDHPHTAQRVEVSIAIPSRFEAFELLPPLAAGAPSPSTLASQLPMSLHDVPLPCVS